MRRESDVQMQKIIRSVLAVVASYFLIYGFHTVTKMDAWWISLIVCFACGYPIMYYGGMTYNTERVTRKEYIIDLHNDKIGDIFVPSRYPNYKKTNSGYDGNDYMSDAGSIICTKYVEKRETVKVKEKGFSIHVCCILICLFSFLLWNAIADVPPLKHIINEHLNIVINNVNGMKKGSGGIINNGGDNLKFLGEGMKEIYFSMKANISKRINLSSDMVGLSNGWKELVSRIVGNIVGFFMDIKNLF